MSEIGSKKIISAYFKELYFRLHWVERESSIASRRVQRESNLMFTLSSDKAIRVRLRSVQMNLKSTGVHNFKCTYQKKS